MLEHSTNFEQMLDEVLVKALPYLIFSPPEFSAKLAAAMASLWQSYEDRYSSGAFAYNVEAVRAMLDCPETEWSSGIALRINSFQRERMSWGMRIWNLEHRVDDLTKAITARPRGTAATKAKPWTAITVQALNPPLPINSAAPMAPKATPTPKPGGKPVADITQTVTMPKVLTPTSLSTTTAPAKRSWPKYPNEYPELNNLVKLLEANNRTPQTINKYVSIARDILVKYNGKIPTDEQYKADAPAEYSKGRLRDRITALRRLREAQMAKHTGKQWDDVIVG
jgi:hypothetical protein